MGLSVAPAALVLCSRRPGPWSPRPVRCGLAHHDARLQAPGTTTLLPRSTSGRSVTACQPHHPAVAEPPLPPSRLATHSASLLAKHPLQILHATSCRALWSSASPRIPPACAGGYKRPEVQAIDGYIAHHTPTPSRSSDKRLVTSCKSHPRQQRLSSSHSCDCATRHLENTGRYLQIWGELGEIYAEIKFGLRRHRTHEAGSDGTIAGKLVEVKTISPEKTSDRVLVKSQGNFEQLLIVRIDRDFQFQGKLFDRSELRGASGKFLRGRLKDDTSNA